MTKVFLAITMSLVSGASVAATLPKPKLSIAQARAIALRKAPGKVTKAEYEKEDGLWRYSFDIRQGKMNHEVGVNANTGAIVESTVEPLGKAD
ncbi:PepSY domain-containing protein [Sphingomonas antarctica]|uniref:PepSY domain-containing protein n=1 Tax=Sphingomonas antarctica TaxID=2040274 RepID=UPI0039EB2F00